MITVQYQNNCRELEGLFESVGINSFIFQVYAKVRNGFEKSSSKVHSVCWAGGVSCSIEVVSKVFTSKKITHDRFHSS